MVHLRCISFRRVLTVVSLCPVEFQPNSLALLAAPLLVMKRQVDEDAKPLELAIKLTKLGYRRWGLEDSGAEPPSTFEEGMNPPTLFL